MKTNIFVAIGIAFILTSCSDEPSDYSPLEIELTRSESNAVVAINDFTFDLMRATEKKLGDTRPNYVMSPQSAAWCISMVANGAKYNSETLKEMVDVLHLDGDASLQDVNEYSSKLISAIRSKKNGTEVRIANAIHFKDYIGIKGDYVNAIKTFYDAESFADKPNNVIDSWISKQTGGMINGYATRFKLDEYIFGVINTMYFSGKWKVDFSKKRQTGSFTNADGTVHEVPMIIDSKAGADVHHNEVCHMLQLNFSDYRYSIHFIIPAENHDLKDVLSYFNGESWKQMVDYTKYQISSVRFPILDVESVFDFVAIIQEMGIKKAFSLDSELSEIAQGKIVMSAFNQHTVLKLDEEGVKASTSSNYSAYPTAVLPGYFSVDEPFYYFITEKSTGAILYAGKMTQM